ncbi:MAG TPA: Bax inhibitor-1/YccA family protein [Edaphocola sp.]|nr:Bax inhibitor-1/YccA family protein [Edaphocola sp.]
MNNNQVQPENRPSIISDKQIDQSYVAKYVTGVFGWMFLALSITAVTALLVANSPAINLILGNKLVFFGLMIFQLVMVGYLSIRIEKMSSTTATAVFLGYSFITGLTFAVLFLVYSAASLFLTFAITAGTFGIMAAVGYFTKADLTSFGKLLFMGLIGIVLASIVNFFMKSPTLYWIISYVGIAVFVGLIAYDTQKIKAYALLETEEARKKGAILGALALYLDFINLFLMLLRLFGRGRD